jgi:hypothetical protein
MLPLPKNLPVILYSLLLAEALLFTWARGELGYYASPVLLLGCSLAACAVAYAYLRGRTWPTQPVAGRPAALGAIWLAGAVGLALTVRPWYKTLRDTEIQISHSDIIPSVYIYTQRLLAGEVIYRPFDAEIGYPLFPTYLPGTWGPYVLPQALGFDYRWLTGGLLLLGIGAYVRVVARLRLTGVRSFILALLPFGLVWAVLRTDDSIVGNTIEMMIVGYYFVLVAGVLLPGRTWRIVGLLLCLLSRFSLVLWVPLYLGLLWFRASRREALLTAAGVAVGVLALYVVPFLAHDWSLLGKAQQTYTNAALGEWQHLNDEGLPAHLYNGIGLANFFYRFAPGDLLARVTLVKQVQAALLLAVTAGLALLYWRQRPPRMDYRLFAVLALKFYLAVFYAFVQVPYAYLALVGIALSVWLVVLVAGAQEVVAQAATAPVART